MDIEQRALAELRQVYAEWEREEADAIYVIEAVGRFLKGRDAEREAHDAFRQEVSEEMRVALRYLDAMDIGRVRHTLSRFIIQPKTDPLVELIRDLRGDEPTSAEEFAAEFRKMAPSRGLEIREVSAALIARSEV